MSKIKCEQAENKAAQMIAALMAAGARTAPKARGIDDVETLILDGAELEELAAALERKAQTKRPSMKAAFIRDANNLRNSACVLLIGVRGNPKKMENPLDCGACGWENCEQMLRVKKRTGDLTGPNCMFQLVDLGIAVGSAVKVASDLNADNRIMYTVGAAAKQLNLLDSDVIMGIPISFKGKNIYFDRKPV